MKFKEYELDLLEVEASYKQNISQKRFWYNHIKKNALRKDGDIFEFGVYRGTSLITAALILKKLKSKKKIYGFDSFGGFPSKSKFDNLNNFQNLNYFGKKFQTEQKRFLKLKKILTGKKIFNSYNVGTSGDFSKTSYQYVLDKIKYLNLKNIKLVKGNFNKTVPIFFKNRKVKISSCNIDCDLYEGYKVILPYIYKNLTKKGYIFLDEYYSLKYPGAKIATDNFCKKLKIKPKKHKVRKGEFERYYILK